MPKKDAEKVRFEADVDLKVVDHPDERSERFLDDVLSVRRLSGAGQGKAQQPALIFRLETAMVVAGPGPAAQAVCVETPRPRAEETRGLDCRR